MSMLRQAREIQHKITEDMRNFVTIKDIEVFKNLQEKTLASLRNDILELKKLQEKNNSEINKPASFK